MTVAFRVVLIVFAIIALGFVIHKIATKKLLMADAVFWFIFVLLMVVLAIFPQIAFFFSDLLGIESPSHLVFLTVLAILLVKEVNSSVQISTLRNQVADLVQDQALDKAGYGQSSSDEFEESPQGTER